MVGFFADINEIANDLENPFEITSPGTTFATSAPVTALRTTPLEDRAVTNRLGTPDDPVVIEAEAVYPVDLGYGGLYHVNLWQESFCRFEAWLDTSRLIKVADTLYANGRARRVVPSLVDPKTLQAGDTGWLRGGLGSEVFRVYATNVHAIVPLCRARVLRWSLWGGAYKPDGTQDTAYRFGLAWAGNGLSIARHAPGSDDGVKTGTELIEQPGGYVWAEDGLRKRTATIDLAAVEKTMRDKIFDAMHRAGNAKPIVWLPRVDSPEDCFRYGGLFRRLGDHSHKYIPPIFASTTMNFLEWRE